MIRVQEQKLPAGLRRLDDQEIVVRGSIGERITYSIFALMFGTCGVLCAWEAVAHPSHRLPGPELCLMALGLFVVTLACWYLTGPRESVFDVRRGTYRLTAGFPFAPRVQRGAIDEIAGLFLTSFKRQSYDLPRFWIYLAWNDPRRQDILLLGGLDADTANPLMCQIAGALGLPAGDGVLEGFWSRNLRLRRCDSDVLAFHKPTSLRLAWGITGKVIAIASLVLSGALVITSGGLHFHSGSTNLDITIWLDIAGLLCLRAAGPEDLVVDLQSRTYRYRYGFLYLSVERQGPLEDIVALKTDRQGSSGGTRVRLVWKQPRRGDMTLGEFRSQEEADAHLRGVAARLGLNLD